LTAPARPAIPDAVRTVWRGGFGVTRLLAVVVLGAASLSGGCASTWDAASSRRFREKPFGTMFGKEEDALATLRGATPDMGDERARAFTRLKEPAKSGLDAAAQDEALQLLSDAATKDPSAYVRVCAIDALGRFQDPRAAEVLGNAYRYAAGKPLPTTAATAGGVVTASAETRSLDLAAIYGAKGFAPDQVANIRCRAIDGLAATNTPEAVAFLARVAEGKEFGLNEDPAGRSYARQRAVDGLGKVRTKEAVVALNKILTAESGRDVALATYAHAGLKGLTGKDAPARPEEWDAIVQAGVEVVPPPGVVQRAISEVID